MGLFDDKDLGKDIINNKIDKKEEQANLFVNVDNKGIKDSKIENITPNELKDTNEKFDGKNVDFNRVEGKFKEAGLYNKEIQNSLNGREKDISIDVDMDMEPDMSHFFIKKWLK